MSRHLVCSAAIEYSDAWHYAAESGVELPQATCSLEEVPTQILKEIAALAGYDWEDPPNYASLIVVYEIANNGDLIHIKWSLRDGVPVVHQS